MTAEKNVQRQTCTEVNDDAEKCTKTDLCYTEVNDNAEKMYRQTDRKKKLKLTAILKNVQTYFI